MLVVGRVQKADLEEAFKEVKANRLRLLEQGQEERNRLEERLTQHRMVLHMERLVRVVVDLQVMLGVAVAVVVDIMAVVVEL